ncbi:MAG TPA: ATP-binding protein [Myxococcaceae bacterium]|nr:ATP-binding protein [Myxococcaceae bacterium]
MTDEVSTGEAAQLERLRRFLKMLLAVGAPSTALWAAAFLLFGGRTLAVAVLLCAAFGGGVLLAWRFSRRGNLGAAVGTVGAALLVTALVGVANWKAAYPVLVLVPATTAVGVIPFLRGRALKLFLFAALADTAAVAAFGIFMPDERPDVPVWAGNVILLVLLLACTGMLLMLLWQFSAWLRESLDRALDSNAELRAGHERFRSLAIATSQILWTTDAGGNVVEDSPSWRDFTGQTQEQRRGMGWLEAVHPDDRERVRQATLRAVADERPFELEYRLRRADGTYADLLGRGAPVRDEQGRIREWVRATIDVTDKKRAEAAVRQSEERSRAIIAALSEGILLQDADGRLRLANASAERLLGVPLTARAGMLARHPDWRTCYEDGRPMPPEEQPSQVALRTGQPQSNVVVGLERPDGTRTWLSVNAQPLFGAGGEPVSVVASFFDITDSKRAEEERSLLLERERKARADAEAANRLKDEFLATVSHELRTPLTAILGWSKLLLARRMPPERQAHALEVIERNAQAQRALVEDLLDVSRIITGKLRLEVQPVDLSEVVDRAIETVRPAAQAKEIRLLRTLDTGGGELSGDPNRLQQVVWNLLSNAIKFTPRGGQVVVRLDATDGYRVLEVRDTGEGIAPAFIPHLFERFRQADSSATRVHGGLGLGLAIVRHVVELHGGRVRADSEGLGKGTRFVVELPIAQAAPVSEEEDLEDSVPPGPVPPPDLTGVRVLVVDDKPDAREVLVAALQQYGANVIAAASTAEALGTLERFEPRVLVSDLGMPGEDGYSLLRQVRALSREELGRVPVVALTGFAGSAERARALEAGFQSHVAKPVDPLALAKVVSRLARGGGGPPLEKSSETR